MTESPIPFLGELCALGSAALWAAAVTLFRPAIEKFGAQAINFVKCTLATLLQGGTVLALGMGSAWMTLSPATVGWIAASSVVGLVLGDTALFSAVRALGVQRTLLLQTLTPIFAAGFAWISLAEVPTGRQTLGAAIILAGITLVVLPDRKTRVPFAMVGALLATAAAAAQALGIVLAKIGMEELHALPASVLRLFVASLGLGLLLLVQAKVGRALKVFRSPLLVRRVLPATLVGTYLAMFLFMASVALAPAAIAAVLIGTAPIFSLIIDAVADRSWPSARSIAGTLLAVAGVGILSSV